MVGSAVGRVGLVRGRHRRLRAGRRRVWQIVGINAEIVAPQFKGCRLARDRGQDALGHGTRQRQRADALYRHDLAIAIEQITPEFGSVLIWAIMPYLTD